MFGVVLRDDKGHKAALKEDLAEEGILETNFLSIWLSNPAVTQGSRPCPARFWPGAKFLPCRIMTSQKNQRKIFYFLFQNGRL